jgi:hypothetical protein
MTTQAVPSQSPTPRVRRRPLGATSRRDRWWLTPALTATTLTVFAIYSIVAAAMNTDYDYLKGGARYLSPFYSPDLRSLFGLHIPFTYAFFVIWAPLGLRTTCYYYRKAYYRSFFLTPPSCAVVGRPQAKGRGYTGESRLPLILQNVHRFFFWFAVAVLGFLWYDAIRAFFYKTSTGTHFGIGLGGVVMLVNVILLSGFTFGCNSFRHLIGGRLDCFTCSASARARHGAWQKVSILNRRHANWAWFSLFSVGLTDLYIRLASAGAFTDPHHVF